MVPYPLRGKVLPGADRDTGTGSPYRRIIQITRASVKTSEETSEERGGKIILDRKYAFYL
jgi:hypothetical protein